MLSSEGRGRECRELTPVSHRATDTGWPIFPLEETKTRAVLRGKQEPAFSGFG